MPRRTGERRSILVISDTTELLSTENPGKRCEVIVGEKINIIAPMAMIDARKTVNMLSMNLRTFGKPLKVSLSMKGMRTERETTEPRVTNKKSGIRKAA